MCFHVTFWCVVCVFLIIFSLCVCVFFVIFSCWEWLEKHHRNTICFWDFFWLFFLLVVCIRVYCFIFRTADYPLLAPLTKNLFAFWGDTLSKHYFKDFFHMDTRKNSTPEIKFSQESFWCSSACFSLHFSCSTLPCGRGRFLDGDDTTHNWLHYSRIKSLKVDITFPRLIILCSAHFQQRATKITPFEMEGPRTLSFKDAPWPLVDWHAWLPDDTQLFYWWNFLPETRRSSSWIQTQMVGGLPFGNTIAIKNLSSSNLPFWCCFLMMNNFFRKARKNDSNVSKNSSPESRVRWTFVCHWCDEDSWQRKLWSWAFESSSCLDFSWLDKPKTWCISERINDLHPKKYKKKNTSKYTLFGCFHVSSLHVTKNRVKKTTWILPTHKIVQSKKLPWGFKSKAQIQMKMKWCNFQLLWTRTKSHVP